MCHLHNCSNSKKSIFHYFALLSLSSNGLCNLKKNFYSGKGLKMEKQNSTWISVAHIRRGN